MCVCVFPAGDSQGVDQQVCVVKQGHLRPLHQQEESELDEQHQSQLPYAADVEEHGAGQQGQQYAVVEILQQREGSEGRGRGGEGGGGGRSGEYSNILFRHTENHTGPQRASKQYTHT